MKKKTFRMIKLNKWCKFLLGIAGISLLLLVLCIIKLNNNEEPKKPSEKNKTEVSEESNDSEDSEEELPVIEVQSDFEEIDDVYHGIITPIAQYDREELPRIVCWGDSLTETDGFVSYPDSLRELTGTRVINYGLHSDGTRQIAMREGAIPLYVSECVIPAEQIPVEVNISTSKGKVRGFLKNGDVGINPCKIGNVSGTLQLNGDSFTFTRSEIGEITPVSNGTALSTYGALNRSSDDVVILFSGANDGLLLDEINNLITNQRLILDDIGSEEYIVIGPTFAESMSELTDINKKLQEEYGDHFLNAYEYLVNWGLSDAGITPTPQDKADIAADNTPSSLRIDVVHGTPTYYDLLAKQVYRKLMYLGYLPLADEYDYMQMENQNGVQESQQNEKITSDINSGEIRVVCWGDSLTEGTCGEGMSYPLSIKNAAENDGKDITVLNYGVYAEESSLICARSGGNPMRLRDSVTIPATCDPVEVVPISDMQGYEMLLVFGGDKEFSAAGSSFLGDNSINPCIIGGVEGNINIDPSDGTRYFTRLTPGDAVVANTQDPIQFWAMRDKRSDDILVIWSGNNDSPTPSTVSSTIQYINKIIEYTGTDKYVVINFPKIEIVPEIDKVNKIMADEFDEHLIDIRSYLRGDAMKDAGLTLTQDDKQFLKDGKIPKSFYAGDDVHFTPRCYELIGEQVYKKLCELGYL